MTYITAADFENETDKVFLEKAIRKAEQLFEVVTRRFYSSHDFENDFEWRKKAVREALIAQVNYFIETGSVSAYELNNEPSSVTLGRTSIGSGRYSTNTDKTSTSNLLCEEFYLLLSGTGLLYRGVHDG